MPTELCWSRPEAHSVNDAGRQIDERGPAPRRDALPLAQLLATIARASDTNETLTGVIRDALAAICSWSQWPVGHFYWFDEDEASINPSGVWTHSESPGFVAFHAASDGLDLHSERGLPGRVAAANGPIWLEDVRHDDRFLRRQEAAEAGLRGALAFPVSDGDRLLGAAEFFSFRPLTLDPELLELSGHIGARLGGQIASWQANAALQASEERFRSLANAANDAIIAADSTDHIIFWNRGAERLFGYSEQEALGQPTAIIIPKDYLEDHNAGIHRMVHHGMKAARVIGVKPSEEVHGLRRNGQRFPLEMSLGTWMTDDERFFISVLRDTTERTEANQRRRLLFEGAPDAMFEIDERGEILQANAQAETLLGRRRHELIGMSVERLATSA
ncbi:MAG TPA: PAS domain S-box protein, partial [Miltoncostaeaceae bacterium]|nr:PAS domain S-box protein [Miltoncostaeaceae bacterium]